MRAMMSKRLRKILNEGNQHLYVYKDIPDWYKEADRECIRMGLICLSLVVLMSIAGIIFITKSHLGA